MDDLINDFITETREGLEALDSSLVQFERSPEDPELLGGIFRLIHTIKGTCGFLGLTRLQTVAHSAENLLGAFRDGELAVTPGAVTVILETVDLIRQLIEALAATGAEPPGDDGALIARLEAILAASLACDSGAAPPNADRPLIEALGGDATLDAACEMIASRLLNGEFSQTFAGLDADQLQGVLRDGLTGVARGEITPQTFIACTPGGDPPQALNWMLDRLGEALAALETPARAVAALRARFDEAVQPVSTQPAGPATAPATVEIPPAVSPVAEPPPLAAPEAAPTVQNIRVSVEALEHLMTVVSELVLIRNQLIQTLRLDPEGPFAAPLHRLNQVTSELQESVMTTRMQPISGAWAKLPRVVRDLAHDLGKQIDLVMSGQETELDRQVLELIKDPLTHMIRNAADHGLETPSERRAAGKSETGCITLNAHHESGAIVIEVADDGRGLPAAKIRAKAIANSLAPAAQIEAMSDAEVQRFIFAPGFSTASTVTSVSGRGVGMDVVRTNIERIGGSIDVASTEGRGACFTIRIPLTLTIVSALIVECCGERFALPQSSVIELVGASGDGGRQIEYVDGAAVLRLRDRLLPLVSLQTLLGLDADQAQTGDACIVVARTGAFTFGVIVDRVFDTEEIVVKPVSSVLRHIKLYSGATILGDGAVILILDFKGMSIEAGAGRALEAAPADLAASHEGGVQSVAMLVFRTADDVLKAAPLSAVARIEEVASNQLEQVEGGSVIQYRGALMPVLSSAPAAPMSWDGEALRPLLVFTRQDRSISLLVKEIVDIVDSVPPGDHPGVRDGRPTSLIIQGSAMDLIDADHLWRLAAGDAAPPEAVELSMPDPVPVTAGKRLLIIDGSPFCQMLLHPLLRQAGYDVEVAPDAEAALRLHDRGEMFQLILADLAPQGGSLHAMATTLARANTWRRTPLFSLGAHVIDHAGFDAGAMLDALHDSLGGAAAEEAA